jgi:hypothetical protein
MRPRPETLAELRRDLVAAAALLGTLLLAAWLWQMVL